MKKFRLQNKAAAYTGRILLYSYRCYMLFKETGAGKPVQTNYVSVTRHQFKEPCYN